MIHEADFPDPEGLTAECVAGAVLHRYRRDSGLFTCGLPKTVLPFRKSRIIYEDLYENPHDIQRTCFMCGFAVCRRCFSVPHGYSDSEPAGIYGKHRDFPTKERFSKSEKTYTEKHQSFRNESILEKGGDLCHEISITSYTDRKLRGRKRNLSGRRHTGGFTHESGCRCRGGLCMS